MTPYRQVLVYHKKYERFYNPTDYFFIAYFMQ